MKATEKLSVKARDLRQEFEDIITEHRQGLWNYCRYLTGSPWDGEDLFQETFIKAMGAYYLRYHDTNTKSYLYRIATNTWIDLCRRQKRMVGELREDNEPAVTISDSLELEYTLERLTTLLSPRQIAVFLLLEVFHFSAKEVAGIVRTTPGAVYSSVNRIKRKLSEHIYEGEILPEEKKISENHSRVIQAYLRAFNNGDLKEMLSLFSDEAQNETFLGFREYSKDEMRNGSLKYGLPGHQAKECILWGKSVVITLADGGNGPLLHDIQYHEVENDKIVALKSFFFRKELILAAAKELGIPAQLNKPPVNWE